MIRTQIVEAIVLGQKDFGEADRLVTIFSKQMGKLTVIAKGVRRITSRRSGNIDVLNNVTLSLARGQSFYIVTEANVIDSYAAIKENLSKAFYAYYLVELANVLTVDEQVHLDVYYLLKQSLDLFAKEPRRIAILAFEIKLLNALGFWSVETLKGENEAIIALARQLTVQSLEKISKMRFNDTDVRHLSDLVRKQVAYVSEHEFKSPKIIAKLRKQIEALEGQG